MSTIVAPFPLLSHDDTPPTGGFWWRLKLLPNADGAYLMKRTNGGDMSTATWCSLEFYDGYHAYIDCGLDRPTRVQLYYTAPPVVPTEMYLDVYAPAAPTPCPRWERLDVPPDRLWPSQAIKLDSIIVL